MEMVWSFSVHVQLADYAPSGEVLGHRDNVAKLNAVVSQQHRAGA